MGRKRINEEQVLARVPGGTVARIERVLTKGEKQAEFLRAAIEQELKRREKKRERAR